MCVGVLGLFLEYSPVINWRLHGSGEELFFFADPVYCWPYSMTAAAGRQLDRLEITSLYLLTTLDALAVVD